jgi:uncharacterized protein YggE
MLKYIVISCLTLLSLNAVSQSNNNNELVAEGSSRIKVKPDLVTFTLTVEKTDTIEKNAIVGLNMEIEKLVKSLNEIGIDNKMIKISDYNISSSQNENEKKKYNAINVLKVEFGIDIKLINSLYNEIQEADLKDLNLSFETKLSDSLENATRFKLVQYSIEEAKANANNIANTLHVKLLRVKQVHKFADQPVDMDKVEMAKFTPPKIVNDNDVLINTSFAKFQVEDIELEERITIVYQISD